jgi:hypothetical protein
MRCTAIKAEQEGCDSDIKVVPDDLVGLCDERQLPSSLRHYPVGLSEQSVGLCDKTRVAPWGYARLYN